MKQTSPTLRLCFALAERAVWPRVDLEELASGLGLLVDGALDALNDAAFDAVGDPLWEGEDPIEVDRNVARDLTGGATTG